MEGGILLSPEGHGKFPECINCGVHPLVTGEGCAMSAFVVVDANGIFPVNGDSAAKELIPSDTPLELESSHTT